MDPNLFFQKCKQQYWDKLNEVKTPWVLVGAASSKHIKSAYRTVWTFIWPLMYCALALTLIYPAHVEDVPCQSGVNHIFEG